MIVLGVFWVSLAIIALIIFIICGGIPKKCSSEVGENIDNISNTTRRNVQESQELTTVSTVSTNSSIQREIDLPSYDNVIRCPSCQKNIQSVVELPPPSFYESIIQTYEGDISIV